MRSLIFAVIAVLAVASAADAKQCRAANGQLIKCAATPAGSFGPTGGAPPIGSPLRLHCPNGVPCGDKCVRARQDCHVPAGPTCNAAKSKPCGNTCIPKSKVCHKDQRKAGGTQEG